MNGCELRKRGEPFGLNHLIELRTPRIRGFEPQGMLHERMRRNGRGARPAGPTLSGVGLGLLEASLVPFLSRVFMWFGLEMEREKYKEKSNLR